MAMPGRLGGVARCVVSAFRQRAAACTVGALRSDCFAPYQAVTGAKLAPAWRAWLPSSGQSCRGFAAKDASGSGEEQQQQASTSSSEGEEQAVDSLSKEELLNRLEEQRNENEVLQAKEKDASEKYKRSLAELQNVTERYRREVDTAKKYGQEPFAKRMLDVVDNLERALESVPAEARAADKTLKGLHEGVDATLRILLQALKQNGVQQYDPIGDKFDPNLHMAMQMIPDPSKEPNTIAIVHKKGYTLHDRVLRAAEVIVVAQPQDS